MTLHNLTTKLYSLSVAGYFNGEKFSINEFARFVHHWMDRTDKLFLTIALPDGEWLMFISKLSDGGYDFTIPETRHQEQRLKEALLHK